MEQIRKLRREVSGILGGMTDVMADIEGANAVMPEDVIERLAAEARQASKAMDGIPEA
jgi:hypothetical protein